MSRYATAELRPVDARVGIEIGYPGFTGWRESNGTGNKQWYLQPKTQFGDVGPQLFDIIPPRPWTVGI